MKKANYRLLILALSFTVIIASSCKSKTKESTDASAPATTADTSMTMAPEPVTIASDDELKKGVADATKDYPGVKAEVTDSVVVLSGEIKRSDWQKLNPTLHSLHSKRVNSKNLTIK